MWLVPLPKTLILRAISEVDRPFSSTTKAPLFLTLYPQPLILFSPVSKERYAVWFWLYLPLALLAHRFTEMGLGPVSGKTLFYPTTDPFFSGFQGEVCSVAMALLAHRFTEMGLGPGFWEQR